MTLCVAVAVVVLAGSPLSAEETSPIQNGLLADWRSGTSTQIRAITPRVATERRALCTAACI